MSLREVYRDEWLLVIDKPFGLASQPARDSDAPDVYTMLSAQEDYVALHHRLDRVASGLLLVGLDTSVNGALAEAFRRHTVVRTYAAVVAGRAPPKGTEWTGPIDGKHARTTVGPSVTASGMSAVWLRPRTGRKHQLRRHAAEARCPMVGDRRYGGDAGRWWPRLALHAARLSLTHPVTGKKLQLSAPIPDDLATVWRTAGGL
jgi:23S rRNA-/tRNA-specific pseudouridylate synthase